ncbi:MAG: hypothetical protein HYV07_32710 [Deltaproteobacteria bacterium]|nr:hypothetical protein [Deltaproteobacteria bacterium]
MIDRAALAALVASVLACDDFTASIGSSCTSGDQCPESFSTVCITSWRDGYCTEYDCEASSCPTGSACVSGLSFVGFPSDDFCLASCQGDTDCRQGYRCATIGANRVCAPADPT